MTQTIREENPLTTITFYGTQQRPDVAVIESRTWGAGNTQNSQFVRLGKLKGNIPLTSNCNFKEISINDSVDDDGSGRGYETGATLDFEPPRLYRRVIYLSQAAMPDRIKLS